MTAGVSYRSPTALYVGAAIKQRRLELGLTQRELACRLGVDPSLPQLWESNKRPVPEARIEALNAALEGLETPSAVPPADTKLCPQCQRQRALTRFGWSPPRQRVTRNEICSSCIRSALSRRLWTDPDYRQRMLSRPNERHNAWSTEELDIIRKYIGTESLAWIAERCTELTGTPRTPGAVSFRAYAIGCSMWREGLSLMEIARTFGVTANTVRGWRRLGLLNGRERVLKRRYRPMWVVTEEELRRFMHAYPWQYDPRRMRPGTWRSLAEVLWRRRPWLGAGEMAQRCGVSGVTVRRWVNEGLIPSERRVGAHGGPIAIPADAVITGRQLRDAWNPRVAARNRTTARQRTAA